MSDMYVTKRNGQKEIVAFDKIVNRIRKIGQEVDIQLNYSSLTMKVIDQLYDGIPTTKIDELTCEQCASLSSQHPDYGTLAARIFVSNHQKNTSASFYNVMKQLYWFYDPNKVHSPLISQECWNMVVKHREEINAMIDYQRDYLFEYFGLKTLERAYLFRINGTIVERPQHMWMRVAIGIHGNNLIAIKETYDLLSQKYFTHATPTLFNAGTPRPQLSSCYLIALEDDSLDGIYDTLKDCARISKWSGGIGLHIHNVRAKDSLIRGTNGKSSGIVPMLRVFNDTARFINQGGKRNGSFAIYLETWHPDIEDFLEMKKNHGDEEMRARDLFYALWVSDLFMERVKTNALWSYFCPNECPGLSDVYGQAFVELYCRYETDGKARRTVNARDLWFKILDSQMETGTPYLLYKDAANEKSNQKNIGTIKSSNLCVAPETKILTDKGHIEIKTLEGQNVNVWNGEEFSPVTIVKTGENQELMEVETNDGSILMCTPYHKFYIQNKYSKSKKHIVLTEAQYLKEGDKIIKCNFPIINNDGKEDFKYAYTHGFFCGDGTYNKNTEQKHKALVNHSYCKRHIDYEDINDNLVRKTNIKCNGVSYIKKPIMSLYGEKKDVLPFLNYRSIENEDTQDRLNVTLPVDINEKFLVPMKGSLMNKMEWFSGYCDADGCIARNGDNQQLQISSIEKEFLINVKMMLQTCGINPKVRQMHNGATRMMPDSNKNPKEYICKPLYRLLITSCELQKLVANGFAPKRLKISDFIPQRNAQQFIYITTTRRNGRKDDTYCFNEPKRNAGIFNGIITSQCTEIMEYSDEKETAVCNLASVALPAFVLPDKTFDYARLNEVVQVITNNLNRIIDINYYPTEKTRRSNLRHRPIGIGVQGLADTFILMDIAYCSEEAITMNKRIFETIYYAALTKSCALSRERYDQILNSNSVTSFLNEYERENETISNNGILSKTVGAYSTFNGSPASQGQLQFDLWTTFDKGGTKNQEHFIKVEDWDKLKADIQEYGLRNSLLAAPMPTASTSQILGYNECFEPLTSNIYSRRTLAGEFLLANKYLMKEMIQMGIWDEKVKNNIIANKGSIQQLTMLPEKMREKYKIVWEMPMKHLIDMSADRGAFICQSQSLNLWLEDPNYSTLTSMHFYAWKKGLKTGIYYLRRKGKHQAQQFTVEPEQQMEKEKEKEEPDICEMCSA